MAQINLHTTPEFEQQLGLLMRLKGIPSKSEAIRMAVAAQARAAQVGQRRRDFAALIGLVASAQPGRFADDNALWEKDGAHGG
ncbi:MAG: hypothetical protein AB7V26_04595 [Lysobacterales bacterium]